MAEKTMYNYKKTLQIPIEFFDITFKRAILLSKNNETAVKIKINEVPDLVGCFLLPSSS